VQPAPCTHPRRHIDRAPVVDRRRHIETINQKEADLAFCRAGPGRICGQIVEDKVSQHPVGAVQGILGVSEPKQSSVSAAEGPQV
jgi:hypothetical protein